MFTRLIGVGVLLFTLVAHSARAEGWKEGKFVPPAPPESSQLSHEKRDFAQGSMEATLARGGASGAYIHAVLRGRHKGREGTSKYVVAILLRDADGYFYDFQVGPQTLTIGSDPLKPAVDKKIWGNFKVTGEALDAVKNGIPLTVVPVGDRSRVGIVDELAGSFQEFLEGKLPRSEFLRLLNVNKTKKK